MSPKLPQVSGKKVIGLLERLGYEVVRQRGSHVRLKKVLKIGVHTITVPKHKSVAKGTLGDILEKVSLWNDISKDELIEMV
ncbi:type II toxin-antitoxin system HicA family toxin [bacterium]|nr:type II toxin-antitoxin system HicA family toxin [bacterium]MBU1599330.1 type II toxin-antitoxin system HicA family toxin [bacterium]